jgi:thioredoxin 1
MVAELTSISEYNEAIKYSGLTVIDFFAVWCGPCKMISPVIEQLAASNKGAHFFKVDVDKTPDVSAEQDVTAMPTLMFYKDGQKVGTVVGANLQKIKALVAQYA